MTERERAIHDQRETASGSADSFVLFARLWALAGVFHFLSFPDWRWTTRPGTLLAAATLLVLARPTLLRFGFFILLDWLLVARSSPYYANHILFSWVVNSTLLVTLAIAWTRRTQGENTKVTWCRFFAPWARVELGSVYFFAVLHKLNTAYFNPEVSCSGSMLRELGVMYPFLPAGPWAQQVVIYGTVIVEAVIPLLLAVRRTRLMGLLLGISFHTMLALHPHQGIFSFTATTIALFSLFLPEPFAARLQPPGWLKKALLGFCVAGFVFLGAWAAREWLPFGSTLESLAHLWAFRIGRDATLLYAAASGILLLWLGARHGRELAGPAPGNLRKLPGLVIFPALLVVIGMQPYLGLRTAVCFSMFSNLQTENGRSNHLFMPDWLQLTDWQRNLVEIVESNDATLTEFQRDGLKIPFLDLRRIRTGAGPDFHVRFLRGGQEFYFSARDPSTLHTIEPLGPLSRLYVLFRPVEPDPVQVHCRW